MTQEYDWSYWTYGDITEWRLDVDGVDVAYVRLYPATQAEGGKGFVCRFMTFEDDAFPDGETYRTLRSAQKWCERHAPIVLMRYSAGVNDA